MKETIKRTREYLEYIEEHYNNVQKVYTDLYSKIDLIPIKLKNDDAYKYFDIIKLLTDHENFDYLKKEIENHDLSKLSEKEFVQYRKHFYPINEQEKMESENLMNEGWENHQKENCHHWQTRTRFDDQLPFGVERYGAYLKEITTKHALDVIHNVIDWIAMAYKFNDNPLNKYYLENKSRISMLEKDFKLIDLIYQFYQD